MSNPLARMSLLFEALNKAARDYRRQNAPVVVPLLSLRSAPFLYGRRGAISAVLVSLLIGVGVGFLVFSQAPSSAAPRVVLSPVLQSEKTPAKGESQPKTQTTHESGIALSADSLDPEAKVADDVRDMAATIKDAPAVTGHGGAASGLIVMEGSGATTSTVLAEAAAATEVKDWRGALAAYDAVLASDQDNRDALLGKIFVLETRGTDDDLEALTALADALPKMAAVYAAKARLFVRRKEMPDALNAWQRAVECDPKNATYRFGLAILNDKMGRTEEALRLYREVPAPLPPEVKRRADYLAATLEQKDHPVAPLEEEE